MPFAALSATTAALVVAAVVVEVALVAFCLVDLVRRPSAAVTLGTKVPWFVIVLLIEFIGPVVYLVAGRRELPRPDGDVYEAHGGDARTADRAQRTVDVLYGPERDG